jgi:hypothetical protein
VLETDRQRDNLAKQGELPSYVTTPDQLRVGAHSLRASTRRERLSLFQIGGVEAFSEPVIDSSKRSACFIATILLNKQPRNARYRAQFPTLASILRASAIASRSQLQAREEMSLQL